MKSISGVGLAEVTSLYGSVQGDFMQLIFGQQIHIGGMRASIDLADRAGIGGGLSGVDLCCCNGAGMRFLVRSRKVASMVGVDATEAVVERGQRFIGNSLIAGPEGWPLAGPAAFDREETLLADLNLAHARRNRSINGFNHVLRDRRADLYGDLGCTGTR